jgi:Uma2 family endonuclease
VATASKQLTLEEFRAQFEGRKPHFEYWFGEPVQKSMPTWLHSVLQGVLVEFLKRAGYKSGSELELRIDPDWQPVPDVTGLSASLIQPNGQSILLADVWTELDKQR